MTWHAMFTPSLRMSWQTSSAWELNQPYDMACPVHTIPQDVMTDKFCMRAQAELFSFKWWVLFRHHMSTLNVVKTLLPNLHWLMAEIISLPGIYSLERKDIRSLNIQQKGIYSLNIQEKGVDSLNILKRRKKRGGGGRVGGVGVHSLNRYTRKRHSQSNHTRKRRSQSENTRKRRSQSEHTRKRQSQSEQKRKKAFTVWTCKKKTLTIWTY